MALPVIYPLLMATVVVSLSIQNRASKERIKLLRDGDGEEKLASMIRSAEKKLDNVIADLVDGASLADSDISEAESLSSAVSPDAKSSAAFPTSHSICKYGKKQKPTLTPAQVRMINSLNSLEFLHKEVAFISNTRFAHAALICRDPKNFPTHEEGTGAIRHWADRFIF